MFGHSRRRPYTPPSPPPSPEPARWLSLDQAAQYVSLSQVAFKRFAQEGQLPAAVEGGETRDPKWDRLAIDAAMESGYQTEPPQPKPRPAGFGFQKKPREVRLPEWPRGMPAEIAAAYVGLPLEAWNGIVAAGDAPAPVALTPEHRVWLRETLDAWLDQKTARGAP
ncbi:MAG TPA: hypothetical protein VIL69_13875 [Roseomonas sp.]|jgi:predicted DNA-binding transcriptional regulator AlpA